MPFGFNFLTILLIAPGLIIGLSMHEYAHAFFADRFGDPTPRYQGRLTLSPASHLDPLGLILFLVVGFGWARPVQIIKRNLRNPRRDDIIISLAGPLTNLLLAIFFLMLLRIISFFSIDLTTSGLMTSVAGVIKAGAFMNVILAVLNILPIPGFDGYHILKNILPYNISNRLSYLDQYFYFFLLGFVILNRLTGFFSFLVGALYTFLQFIIFGTIL